MVMKCQKKHQILPEDTIVRFVFIPQKFAFDSTHFYHPKSTVDRHEIEIQCETQTRTHSPWRRTRARPPNKGTIWHNKI